MDIAIDWELLENISYQTHLGKSLKNTLRKFDKTELMGDLYWAIRHYTDASAELDRYEKRIKSMQSCMLKYAKYSQDRETYRVFNDLLGIRIIVDSYLDFDKLTLPEHTRIADMRNGKANDDGYRGIHVYYQKSNLYYPIELQFVTERDKIFNEWLHIYVYKIISNSAVGIHLRALYDCKSIGTEDEFRRELENVLFGSKKL